MSPDHGVSSVGHLVSRKEPVLAGICVAEHQSRVDAGAEGVDDRRGLGLVDGARDAVLLERRLETRIKTGLTGFGTNSDDLFGLL